MTGVYITSSVFLIVIVVLLVMTVKGGRGLRESDNGRKLHR